jgi:predicted aconitase
VVDGLSFDSIDEAEASWLEKDFEEGEVVKVMNGDNALGPNDYSKAFFQACLVVLKEDVMKVFREFHA